jgi:hypothetical protein
MDLHVKVHVIAENGMGVDLDAMSLGELLKERIHFVEVSAE